jgi:hypothetical protein
MSNAGYVYAANLNINRVKYFNNMSQKYGLVKLTRLEVKNYNRFNNQLDKLKENSLNGIDDCIHIKGRKVFYDPVDICFYKLM